MTQSKLIRIWLRIQPILASLMIGVGLIWLNQVKINLTNARAKAALEIQSQISQANFSKRPEAPLRLKISSAEIDQLINPTLIVDGNWQTSNSGVSYLISSARPRENSNIVIYGHNLKQVFGKLDQVQLGDIVELQSLDHTAKYQVSTRNIVNPDAIEIALPTPTETLTLYTCIGRFDSQRLVLTAKPVSIHYRTIFSSQI